MPRKPKPRQVEAGEVVSFFEEMPVEHAALILSIVTARVAKRQAQANRGFEEPAAPAAPKKRKSGLRADPDGVPVESLSNA